MPDILDKDEIEAILKAIERYLKPGADELNGGTALSTGIKGHPRVRLNKTGILKNDSAGLVLKPVQ